MADKGNQAVENGAMGLEIDERVALGNYTNLAIISHSSSEFVIDFAAHLPGMPKPKVHSRVIIAPEHAKRLLYSLQENINRYEAKNGSIEITRDEKMNPAELINSKLGEA